jgi:opacity protein-like surface antigen
VSASATILARNTTTTDVSTLSGMINGYWHIGTFEGITPCVGAGVYFADLSTSDQTTTGGIAIESRSKTDNLARSLNAGAVYELFQNTALDINYWFINLGDFRQSVSTTYGELSAHEVRSGLRFKF